MHDRGGLDVSNFSHVSVHLELSGGDHVVFTSEY